MADVTIEVLPDVLTVSEFEPGMGLVDQQLIWGDDRAKARAMQHIARGFMRTATHMMGFGIGTLQKRLDDPVDLSHLEAQLDRMDQIGLPKTMTLYNVPGPYKVRVQADGTAQMLDSQADHFSDKGRPSPALFDKLMDLMRHPVRLALQRGVRSLYVWNEAKGFYFGPAPHTWALDEYVHLYNAVGELILDTAEELGIPGDEVRIGGPYVPIRVQTVKDGSSLPDGHPLNGPWGGVKQEAIHFLEGFVARAKRLNALVIDIGLGLTEGKPRVDEFTNCARIPAIVNYVRNTAQAAGWRVPVELAEFYLEPQDLANTNPDFRAALAAEALRHVVEVGIGTAFVWGFRHGGESAILTPTDKPDGGAPLPVWEVFHIFKEHFSRGKRIHKLALAGEGASAIANDHIVLMINHTGAPRTVALHGTTQTLPAYGRSVLPWRA